jgi:hypothetical protein
MLSPDRGELSASLRFAGAVTLTPFLAAPALAAGKRAAAQAPGFYRYNVGNLA